MGDDVRRTVMGKEGVNAGQVDREVERTLTTFAAGLKTAGVPIKWSRLDLAKVDGRNEQIRLIKEWGGVKVTRTDQPDGQAGFAA